MSPMHMKRRGALAALLIAVAVASMATFAFARGSSTVRAGQPSYSSTSLRLSGTGAFRVSGKSASVNVNVCLQKRSGGTFIDVRCSGIKSDSDKSVVARASVPGCVSGAWRTTASGYATTRKGAVKLAKATASRTFHC